MDRSESQYLVIDASLTLRLVVRNPAQSIVQERFQKWAENKLSFITPSLWVYEITSAINKSVFFKHLTIDEGTKALEQALALRIEVVVPNETLSKAAFSWTQRLHRASAYDSFYLALADEYNAPLWTADGKLYRAVNQDWCQLGTE